jgi:hypothetical protein
MQMSKVPIISGYALFFPQKPSSHDTTETFLHVTVNTNYPLVKEKVGIKSTT